MQRCALESHFRPNLHRGWLICQTVMISASQTSWARGISLSRNGRSSPASPKIAAYERRGSICPAMLNYSRVFLWRGTPKVWLRKSRSVPANGPDSLPQNLGPPCEASSALLAWLAAPFPLCHDFLYQMESSMDDDPSPGLERIQAVLLAISSAEDERKWSARHSPRTIPRGFLPWRLSDAGRRCMSHACRWPASESVLKTGLKVLLALSWVYLNRGHRRDRKSLPCQKQPSRGSRGLRSRSQTPLTTIRHFG
jgi:hypothetical protein